MPRDTWALETCQQQKRELCCRSGDLPLFPSWSCKQASRSLNSCHLWHQFSLVILSQCNSLRDKWFFKVVRPLFHQFSSVQLLSRVRLCDPMNRSTPGLPVHHQLPEFTQNSRPLSRWCHPDISSSVIPFSSWPQSLPASGSFPMSQLFVWGSQSIGVSASASVLPMNTQDWSPLGWTGWISLQSKGLSSSQTVIQGIVKFSHCNT